MNIVKILVDFHEGKKDYVTATAYDFHGKKIMELLDVAKPEDVSDYTLEWKNGLIEYYKNMYKMNTLDFDSKIITM